MNRSRYDRRDGIVDGYFYFRVSKLDISVPLRDISQEGKGASALPLYPLNDRIIHALKEITQKFKKKVIHYA